MSALLLLSCSYEQGGLRSIRAHNVEFFGIVHGSPVEFAGRYCKYCHGAELAGGPNGEPSCFQCHGKRWRDIDPGMSRAADDHTTEMGGFRHHPDLLPPVETCTSCHGDQLQGSSDLQTPSCILCHEQKW